MPMPGYISKGCILENLDKACNGPDRDAFYKALNDESQPLFEIWKTFGVLEQQWQKDHLSQHWFNKDGWWKDLPGIQPVEPIMRRGLIKALDLANKPPQFDPSIQIKGPLPVDNYWICGGRRFQMVMSVNERQVILIILSPEQPKEEEDRLEREKGLLTKDEN